MLSSWAKKKAQMPQNMDKVHGYDTFVATGPNSLQFKGQENVLLLWKNGLIPVIL